MNKYLKWALILAPVAIGILLVFQYTKKAKTAKPGTNGTLGTNPNTNTGSSSTTSSGSGSGSSGCTFPLTMGSSNSCVMELQLALLNILPDSLPVYGADGKFGNETKGALMQFNGNTQVNSRAELDQIIAYINGD